MLIYFVGSVKMCYIHNYRGTKKKETALMYSLLVSQNNHIMRSSKAKEIVNIMNFNLKQS